MLMVQLAASALGQQPQPSPTPRIDQQKPAQSEADDVVRITTNLVQVDAVVTDKNGRPVTDLKAEEVEILEDGRPQKITNFSYYLAESPAADTQAPQPKSDNSGLPLPAKRLKPEDVRRTIALVVDDLGLSFESTYYVRRALKKFVDEQMQPGDLVAIIRTSGGMGALQQFTADKRQLYAAIERVKFYMNGRAGMSAFAPIEPPTPGTLGPEVDAANEELDQFRESVYAVGTLGAVNYVVRGLRDLPGRKSVLLISDGFRIYSSDDPTRNYRTLVRLRRLIDEAARAAVVIYTINATGLQTLGFTAADNLTGRDSDQLADALADRRTAAFETQEGLDYLAYETGGIPIRNTNDLSGGIRKVLEDQKGYYLIGYRPDDATFDRRLGRAAVFHRLSLKVKRPGKFNVRMRHGFMGITDEERPKPRTLAQQLFNALVSPFGSTGVHLQLTSLFANDPKLGSIMRSLLYIDPGDLTFTQDADGFHKTTIDVMAITFGDNGIPIDQLGRTYGIKISNQEFERVMKEGIVYYLTVPIKKAGAYQLRVSLRDATSERIGSASQFVEAPDIKKKRLALSGILLNGGGPAGANASTAAMALNAEAGPALRRFHQGMILNYGLFIYNARSNKGTSQPQLTTQVRLFREGKEVFVGRVLTFDSKNQTDFQRLVAGGAIQLGKDMPPGEYVLQVLVTDALADKKHQVATQWIDFQIVK